MAKADWDRCFWGTIKRETDAKGNPVVYGKVKVLNGFICAQAKDQWELGDMLDEMVLMVLEFIIMKAMNRFPLSNINWVMTKIRKTK